MAFLALCASQFALPQNREWASTGPDGAGMISSLAIDQIIPNTVYAGTWGGGVFKTTNGGQSWDPANDGLHYLYVQATIMNPTDPQTLYVGCFWGSAYKSTDGDRSWTPTNTGLSDLQVYALAIDPSDPQAVYAGSNDGNCGTDVAVWQPEPGIWYVLPNNSPGDYSAIQ